MGAREETLAMLRSGMSPKDITRARSVSINTTLGYLDQLVGQGDLRRSDVFFSVPKDVRISIGGLVDIVRKGHWTIQHLIKLCKENGKSADYEDIITILKYGDSRHALGDMYEDIREIETRLHEAIQITLEEEYGEGEMEWWREGITLSIRQNCQARREEDEYPVEDPYDYTELLDLWTILDKKWIVLKKVLPENMIVNKQTLHENFIHLNQIRRNVMHPVRGIIPSEEDFEFIRKFKTDLFPVNK